MNIQRKNSAHHFRMQSERGQTLVVNCKTTNYSIQLNLSAENPACHEVVKLFNTYLLNVMGRPKLGRLDCTIKDIN